MTKTKKIKVIAVAVIATLGAIAGGWGLWQTRQEQINLKNPQAQTEECQAEVKYHPNTCSEVALYQVSAEEKNNWENITKDQRTKITDINQYQPGAEIAVAVFNSSSPCPADRGQVTVLEDSQPRNLAATQNQNDPYEFYAFYTIPTEVTYLDFTGKIHYNCAEKFGEAAKEDPKNNDWWRTSADCSSVLVIQTETDKAASSTDSCSYEFDIE